MFWFDLHLLYLLLSLLLSQLVVVNSLDFLMVVIIIKVIYTIWDLRLLLLWLIIVFWIIYKFSVW